MPEPLHIGSISSLLKMSFYFLEQELINWENNLQKAY